MRSELRYDGAPWNHALHHRTISVITRTKTNTKKIMLIVHVQVRVKPESVEAFRAASAENARHSAQEPGIARFEVVQQRDDPTRFVFLEVFRTDDAPAAHRETAHYKKWRETVDPMMAEPRTSAKYTEVFPEADAW